MAEVAIRSVGDAADPGRALERLGDVAAELRVLGTWTAGAEGRAPRRWALTPGRSFR